MNFLDIEKSFLGRQDVLNVLKKRMTDLKEGYRQNIALLGYPYVGKSFILYHFLRNLDDRDVIAIYLDLENKDFPYFLDKFIGSLLYNFSKNCNLPLSENISVLLETTKQVIPHTVQVIRKVQADFTNGKSNAAYQGLLALPEVFTNETGKYCVLILDEFQGLKDYPLTNAFQVLGKKIMTQKRCLYVVSSSFAAEAKKIITEKLSLLFGNFETIVVEPFDLAASQEFIERRLAGIKVGGSLSSFLTDFTGGHPLYLELICREMISLSALHNQMEVYMPILAQAVENTLFDRWGVLSRHFELLVNEMFTGKGNRTMSELLISLANGHHKLEDLANDLGLKRVVLIKKMNNLLEKSIVVKNGKFYYYKDKLFKYWVKYVYQKRMKDVELAPDKQQRMFKEEFQAHIESFKLATRQDFSSRVVDLLHCFDNESLHLKGRKYRLPQFREIVPFRTRDENGLYLDFIKAKTDDAVWFIVTKKDHLSEGELDLIMAEARKIANKSQRCLIISLSDLDENARLRALQEKFWIWNEGELNALLTLFDKPYIVR
ncbi:MAG TPA: ATP-binding protein [Candidatus Omnitrophota bacterium]|nr:ATP-binding protein [Candidatus Omnitrophota bacterium]